MVTNKSVNDLQNDMTRNVLASAKILNKTKLSNKEWQYF